MADEGIYPVFNWGDMPNPDLPPFVPKGAAGGAGAQGGNYADTFAGPQGMYGMPRGPRRGQYGPQLSMPQMNGPYNASMHVPRDYNLSMMQLLSALMRMRRG